MLHKTKAIVLRTTKYGDTSLICQMFTEMFGLQSYLIKGVRSPRSRTQKANILYPASELDMVVYHQPNKNFQVIKEYQHADTKLPLQQDVLRNCIALFSMEVLMQLLTQDDIQPELFYFSRDFLRWLTEASREQVSNLPLFFLVQAGRLSGYQLSGAYTAITPYLDLQEGRFSETQGHLPPFIGGEEASLMSRINNAGTIAAISSIRMDNKTRQNLLQNFLFFFRLHAPHFRELKSLPVLSAILSE